MGFHRNRDRAGVRWVHTRILGKRDFMRGEVLHSGQEIQVTFGVEEFGSPVQRLGSCLGSDRAIPEATGRASAG